MEKLHIIIADKDEDFALRIEKRLEETLGGEAEITIITDRDYLVQYFSVPKTLSAVLIDRSFYFRALEKHSIEWMGVVTDNPDDCTCDGSFVDYIYRYSALKDIAQRVLIGLDAQRLQLNKATSCKTILVASPIGGCGKTVTALALCSALKKRGKKILFIDTTSLQSSGTFLAKPKKSKGDSFIQDNLFAAGVGKIIEHSAFDYIPPFTQTLPSLGVTVSDYIDIIRSLASTEEYDYIVIDSSSDFSVETAELLSISERVVLITLQDSFSVDKMNKFFNAVDCSNPDKIHMVCGMFRPERKNELQKLSLKFENIGYIPFAAVSDESDIKDIGNMRCYKQLAAAIG